MDDESYHLRRAKEELDKENLTAQQASTHALISIARGLIAVVEQIKKATSPPQPVLPPLRQNRR